MAKRIAERAELAAALARGDRLASVGVMSAQVAHEINNPLTTVLGYAKLLLEDKPEGHPDRNALELIADEAERMKKIIGGLLEYARAPRPSEPATQVATGAVAAERRSRRRSCGTSPRSSRRSCAARRPARRRGRAAEAGRRSRRTRSSRCWSTWCRTPRRPARRRSRSAPGPRPATSRPCITVTDDGPGIPAPTAPRVRPVLHDQGARHRHRPRPRGVQAPRSDGRRDDRGR